jgi:hypothetical protein
VQAHPATAVQSGGREFAPQQRFLTEEEAFDVAVRFRGAHPHRLALLNRILGWGDLRQDAAVRAFVRAHPFVAFRPLEQAAPQGDRAPEQ